MALFLGLAVLGLSFVFLGVSGANEVGILGGPDATLAAKRTGVDQSMGALAMLMSRPSIPLDPAVGGPAVRSFAHLAYLGHGILAPAVDPPIFGGGAVVAYTVERGDTLSGIAKEFGVSVQTIIQSNPDAKSRALQIGQKLTILPVSGILHTIQEGETAESVAHKYGIALADLEEWNHNTDVTNLSAGITLTIPGASSHEYIMSDERTSMALPSTKGYFMQPAKGFNWGRLHHYNAVDVANSCGTPIVAAADGLVIDVSLNNWSQGYGHYVTIEHPNDTKTKYSHLDKISAAVGDYVKRGDGIGTMGATGEATGCHVHFEVYGVKNPFVK